MSILAALGRVILGLFAAIGRVSILGGNTLSHMVRPP